MINAQKRTLIFRIMLIIILACPIFVSMPHMVLGEDNLPPAGGAVDTADPPGGRVDTDPAPCDPSKELCNPIRFDTIQCFFKEVLKLAAQIGSVFIVIGIIYSGFLFVSARGNQEELSKAKRAITYTAIGAALVLGAWAFAVGIANTINTITNGVPVNIECEKK